MSLRELDRVKCIQAVLDGELRARHAAERLAMSSRQVHRLVQRYRLEGAGRVDVAASEPSEQSSAQGRS